MLEKPIRFEKGFCFAAQFAGDKPAQYDVGLRFHKGADYDTDCRSDFTAEFKITEGGSIIVKRLRGSVPYIVWILASSGLAAEPPLVVPPPELERLAFTNGVWDTQATCRFTSTGKEFIGTSVETVQWSTNRQFLISHQFGLLPVGWVEKLVITTWNPAKHEYELVEVLPGGNTTTMRMTFDGKVAKISAESKDGDQVTRTWLTVEYLSPAKYTFRCECSADNGPRWVCSEGTSTKRVSPEH